MLAYAGLHRLGQRKAWAMLELQLRAAVYEDINALAIDELHGPAVHAGKPIPKMEPMLASCTVVKHALAQAACGLYCLAVQQPVFERSHVPLHATVFQNGFSSPATGVFKPEGSHKTAATPRGLGVETL